MTSGRNIDVGADSANNVSILMKSERQNPSSFSVFPGLLDSTQAIREKRTARAGETPSYKPRFN
jgi:hypothetical protein